MSGSGRIPLWLVATVAGTGVIVVLGLFFYGAYAGLGSSLQNRPAIAILGQFNTEILMNKSVYCCFTVNGFIFLWQSIRTRALGALISKLKGLNDAFVIAAGVSNNQPYQKETQLMPIDRPVVYGQALVQRHNVSLDSRILTIRCTNLEISLHCLMQALFTIG